MPEGLDAVIREEIAAGGGFLRLDRYMALCLTHPEFGYYTTRDPLGAVGDFTTAPEISQMFGELIGLWFAQVWQDQGRPERFTLLELGPGRGTLMADLLRAGGHVPGFRDAADVVLFESSLAFRAAQAKRLQDVRWAEDLDDLPPAPLFVVANEFFDALPIRQFQRIGDIWVERGVAAAEDGGLRFATLPVSDPAVALPHAPVDGMIFETCESGGAIASLLGGHIGTRGGAALIVDYGSWDGVGDTFQALLAHKTVDPLERPGEADLTAHVRFSDLAEASLLQSYLADQGSFLQSIGIGERARSLAKDKPSSEVDRLADALHRLTASDQMGGLFKVLALARKDAPPLPGLPRCP